jgi:hypothetical protein
MAISTKRSRASEILPQRPRKSARSSSSRDLAATNALPLLPPPPLPRTVSESQKEYLFVGDSRIERDRKICRRQVTLPELVVKHSEIPQGGLGVFAKNTIKRGDWVTEYGGEVIDSKTALQRRIHDEDTHIRSAGFQDQCIDSRLRGVWDYDYYERSNPHKIHFLLPEMKWLCRFLIILIHARIHNILFIRSFEFPS